MRAYVRWILIAGSVALLAPDCQSDPSAFGAPDLTHRDAVAVVVRRLAQRARGKVSYKYSNTQLKVRLRGSDKR